MERPALILCPLCTRHVRATEQTCPFCRGDMSSESDAQIAPLLLSRVSRSALVALSTVLAATGCNEATTPSARGEVITNITVVVQSSGGQVVQRPGLAQTVVVRPYTAPVAVMPVSTVPTHVLLVRPAAPVVSQPTAPVVRPTPTMSARYGMPPRRPQVSTAMRYGMPPDWEKPGRKI